MAYLTPAWPQGDAANGVVTYTAHLVGGLRDIGHHPYVITLSRGKGPHEEFVLNAAVSRPTRGWTARLLDYLGYRVSSGRWRALSRAALVRSQLAPLVREAGVQILEIEESFRGARELVRRSPIPVVVRLHGPWFLVAPSLGLKRDAALRRRVRDEGLAIANAAAVSAPSNDVLRRVRKYYGLALPEARVIPNPIKAVPACDRWSGASCERGRILFVGRFDRCKGADTMIDAFGRVAAVCPSSRLTFVGPDRGLVDEDGRQWHLEEFLESRLPDCAVRSRVERLGPQPASRVAELRRLCFVTVVCSRYENSPMVALEAMASGCPLVASDVGGLPEMIQHERNGLLCQPGNPDGLAQTILTLLRCPEIAAHLGQQASRDAERRYHPEAIAKQTLDFYRQVIARATRAGKDLAVP